MKLKTVFTMDWGWAVRYTLKRSKFLFGFWWSRLIGRKYWTVDVGGAEIKLTFHTPYHERMGSFLQRGLHEKNLLEWWLKRAQHSKIIYDIGGFNGIYGILAAKINPGAVVRIFEPDPVNILHTEENVQLNNVPNCFVEKKALGDTVGFLSFIGDGSTGGRLSVEGNFRVPVERLGAYEAPDLVKIDVEGGELAVLRGAGQALKNAPPMIFEVSPKTSLVELRPLLLSLGYTLPQQILPGNYTSEQGILTFAEAAT